MYTENIWIQYNTSNVVVLKKFENIHKLPSASQKSLHYKCSLNSLPTSFLCPPWYHNNYRVLLMNINEKYNKMMEDVINDV